MDHRPIEGQARACHWHPASVAEAHIEARKSAVRPDRGARRREHPARGFPSGAVRGDSREFGVRSWSLLETRSDTLLPSRPGSLLLLVVAPHCARSSSACSCRFLKTILTAFGFRCDLAGPSSVGHQSFGPSFSTVQGGGEHSKYFATPTLRVRRLYTLWTCKFGPSGYLSKPPAVCDLSLAEKTVRVLYQPPKFPTRSCYTNLLTLY
jgi:hypothetical protein